MSASSFPLPAWNRVSEGCAWNTGVLRARHRSLRLPHKLLSSSFANKHSAASLSTDPRTARSGKRKLFDKYVWHQRERFAAAEDLEGRGEDLEAARILQSEHRADRR